MIILDIDQDYFFLPVFSGTLIDNIEERNKIYYKAECQPKSLINKFNLKDYRGEVVICENHDEVYHKIKKLGKRNKLIHIDAHDDVCHDETLETLNIGNWITYGVLDDLIDPDIVWINQLQDEKYVYEYNIFNKHYRLHTSTLDNFQFSNKVDLIFYTRSREFCPTSRVESEFLSLVGNINI